MKKFISIVVIVIVAAMTFNCTKAKGYTIKGTVVGAADGDTVSLIEGRGNEMEVLANAVVKNGKFTITGEQDSTRLLFLSYVSNDMQRNATASLFVENAEILVTLNPDSAVADVRGTHANEIWTAFARHNEQRSSVGMKAFYASIDTAATPEARKAAKEQLDAIEAELTDFYKDFIQTNRDNVVGQFVLASYAEQLEDEDFVKTQLDAIDMQKAIPAVRRLKQLKDIQAETAVGKPYKDITAETPGTEILSVSNFVGRQGVKLLMIDFWASWCGPCRAEMPNVKAVYERFHSQGLEILGVSLDNDEDDWREAIDQMDMTWPQISDLCGWESAGAAAYGVRAIPATVLIKDGIIVARNVRGAELAKKVEELLQQD